MVESGAFSLVIAKYLVGRVLEEVFVVGQTFQQGNIRLAQPSVSFSVCVLYVTGASSWRGLAT
jgi:hypothetical protein